jgi:hypothetical protein
VLFIFEMSEVYPLNILDNLVLSRGGGKKLLSALRGHLPLTAEVQATEKSISNMISV